MPSQKVDKKSKVVVDAPPSVPVEVEAAFQLSEINVVFPKGKMSLIVGPTASGKTALCLALLGGESLLDLICSIHVVR